MAYGWSEEQLERVNARRARRGQMPLRQEYDKRKAESDKPRRRFPETDEDETRVAGKRGPMFIHRKKMLA